MGYVVAASGLCSGGQMVGEVSGCTDQLGKWVCTRHEVVVRVGFDNGKW